MWLATISVEWNRGYNQRELYKLLRIARENRATLMEAWREYFGIAKHPRGKK
ncbi:MAG: hypothetical protein HY782_08730 [Chloroflexi bacterium]|nr:hypothetical protein [Chloroflexota bacterium]